MEDNKDKKLDGVPGDNCDKNNPNDPHYADRDKGDYNETCVWIWDIGLSSEENKES